MIPYSRESIQIYKIQKEELIIGQKWENKMRNKRTYVQQ